MKSENRKIQYRIQLEQQVAEDLNRAAESFGFVSGQQLAAGLIRQFLPIYTQKQAEIMRKIESVSIDQPIIAA